MKLRVVAIALLLLSVAYGQVPTTPTGFYIPAHGTPNWDFYMNANFTRLDSMFTGLTAIPSINVSNTATFNNVVISGTCTGSGCGGTAAAGTPFDLQAVGPGNALFADSGNVIMIPATHLVQTAGGFVSGLGTAGVGCTGGSGCISIGLGTDAGTPQTGQAILQGFSSGNLLKLSLNGGAFSQICTLISGCGANVSNSGTPTVHQTAVWVTATTVEGIGPGTAGQVLTSNGASVDPSFQNTTSGDTITSPNGTITVGGTAAATTLDVTGAAGKILAGATPALTASPTLGAVGTQGTLNIAGTTSGTLSITTQGVAGTPTWTAGTSSGTPAVTASSPLVITNTTGNIACATCATTTSGGALSATAPVAISAGGAISITGAAGQVLAGSTPAFTATPTLGASGTLGSLTFGNATSGLLTLQTATGAITSYTVNLPVAQPTSGNTFLSCTAANPAVCTWNAGGAAQAWREIPLSVLQQGTNATNLGCSIGWDMPPTGVAANPTCYDYVGTSTLPSKGSAAFASGAQMSKVLQIPDGYVTNTALTFRVSWVQATDTNTAHTATWGWQMVCQDPTSSASVIQPTYGTEVDSAATTIQGTVGHYSSVDTVITPNAGGQSACSAQNQLFLRLILHATTATDSPQVVFVAWKDQ